MDDLVDPSKFEFGFPVWYLFSTYGYREHDPFFVLRLDDSEGKPTIALIFTEEGFATRFRDEFKNLSHYLGKSLKSHAELLNFLDNTSGVITHVQFDITKQPDGTRTGPTIEIGELRGFIAATIVSGHFT